MSDKHQVPVSTQELRILDLTLRDGNLRGELRIVKPIGGARVNLFLGGTEVSAQTASVLGVCIQHDATQQIESSSRRYAPDFLGEASGAKLYCWSERDLEGKLAVVILPQEYSSGQFEPLPARIETHDGRIVLFWESAARRLTWMMRKAEPGDVLTEVVHLREGIEASVQQLRSQSKVRRTRRVASIVGALAAMLVLGFAASQWLVPGALGPKGGDSLPALRGVRVASPSITQAQGAIYGRSYALVVGIDRYPSEKWADLSYAKNDAEGFAKFLSEQGFDKIYTLYDADATKTAILNAMQSEIARNVQKEDRVLVFFAGHGYTERLGGKDWGYIVPSDAKDSRANYISMEELQTQSEKMGSAKHQLFVLDACYGGLFAMRAGGVDETMPDYINEITRRTARQVITAGGSEQQVMDGGPGGHSVFTGHMLQAVREGLADNNADGYVTFAELTSYVVPRASNRFQTPAFSSLPGHGNGEFVFKVSSKPANN